MSIEIVPLQPNLLPEIAARALELSVGPYHQIGWLDVLRAAGEHCDALVALEHGRVIDWTFYSVRSGSAGTVVTSVPLLAYGGPAVAKAPAVIEQLLRQLRGTALERSAAVLTVGLSPLTAADVRDACVRGLQVTQIFEARAQVHDELSAHPTAGLDSRARAAIRTRVKKARERGLTVIDRCNPAQFAAWLKIYRDHCAQIGARPRPDEFHEALYTRGVADGFVEMWGVLDGHTLIGGILFLRAGEVVDYFAPAFLADYREVSPNTLLLNEAFDRFVASGVRRFNWEASAGMPGVYEFKARWGAADRTQHYLVDVLQSTSPLLDATPQQLQDDFPHRFVLPYALLRTSE